MSEKNGKNMEDMGKTIESGVVNVCRKLEDGVMDACQKVEKGAVKTLRTVEDLCSGKPVSKEEDDRQQGGKWEKQ